ncbi:glycine/D-amino acid oxidase-like deaminating enzyme [Natranaerovirga pectinivora]|uniref:Glycine/D-amino acid oxidase-like deaminating enzyme n=1 Tax=Natranaerovirga pectinivora TaxID=682400 RepID=A0A4R3MP85_9FIRM|nr:FAD-dependent oxidoreductase [Natranaerovirga pectinivora]TCT16342.1 glycine/D-amino acid oxidase-like deaminating enzyme [Natranaerovirga pectinivora]
MKLFFKKGDKMKLYAGTPYWSLISDTKKKKYPKLVENIECDVLIVGGGITGALSSYYMNQANIDTVLIDKNAFASGSTMVNTSLLHYEIDTTLYKLSKMYGKPNAIRCFQLCRRALYDLKSMLNDTGLDCEYVRRKSLYVSTSIIEDIKLLAEYHSRRSAGFKASFVSKINMKKYFNLPYNSGIYSYDGAEINPYLLTKNLIDYTTTKGLRAYENTELISIDFKKDYNIAHTKDAVIKAKKIIFATGYECQSLVDSYTSTNFYVTYNLTTKPITNAHKLWKDNSLIWEAKNPYNHIRRTKDNRIIVGGYDTSYKGYMPNAYELEKKGELLYKQLHHLFPKLDIEKDFVSAGLFARTKDDLGYVGDVEEYPNCYFILGYGANGILYSIIGSQIIRDLYLHGYHHDAALFSFYR